eukprot:CAMPEP_0113933672 /NCGR_PEP_ID=MMETSP1339-20121228/930_1 /TAXON_ID=94617 /ORGANISM="Fibrocapsa japonica" /LENGTH=61 /DNA_ID=CAMNT_0000935079 /DNA_START=41 /DNA_END=223 /DNA_ORIENTATION=- /assembly_acc=CAM_ASM_000762
MKFLVQAVVASSCLALSANGFFLSTSRAPQVGPLNAIGQEVYPDAGYAAPAAGYAAPAAGY